MSIKQRVEKELSLSKERTKSAAGDNESVEFCGGYELALTHTLTWIKEEAKPKPKLWKHTLGDENLARWMFSIIAIKYKYSSKPNDQFHQWADEIRKIREKYKVALTDIRVLFLWAHNNGFWSDNVRSPAKLYAQFETLAARRQQEQDNGHGSNPHIR